MLKWKAHFTFFILVFTLVGCSNANEANLIMNEPVNKESQTLKVEGDVRDEIKEKIDSLQEYELIEIRHLTKGIQEPILYEPEYPKEIGAGMFKVLYQNGNDKKSIILQTEEKVGHLSNIQPGETVIDGYIFYYDGDYVGSAKENNDLKFTKVEERYFIEQIYKRFSEKMTKDEAPYLNSLKDYALAIYFNGK